MRLDASSGCRLSGGLVEFVERERWAAELAAAEAPDRTQQADCDGAVVEVDDHAVFAVQVAGSDVAVDPDRIADTELGDRIRGAHGVQQRAARVDGVRQRD
jgi:hypothetical protein